MNNRNHLPNRYLSPWFAISSALLLTGCGAAVNLDGVRELGKQAAVAQQSLPALAADIKGSCLRSARWKIDNNLTSNLSGRERLKKDLVQDLSALGNYVDTVLAQSDIDVLLRSLDQLPAEQATTERVRELLSRVRDGNNTSDFKARLAKIQECQATYDDKLPLHLQQSHDVLLNYLIALGKLASDDQARFDTEVQQLAAAIKGAAGPLSIPVTEEQVSAGQQILSFLLRMFAEEKRRGVLFDQLKKTGPAVVAYTPFLIATIDAYERRLLLERESITTFYLTAIDRHVKYLQSKADLNRDQEPFGTAFLKARQAQSAPAPLATLTERAEPPSEPLPLSVLLMDRQWSADKRAVDERLVAARAYRRILQLIAEQARTFAADPDGRTITLDSLNGRASQLALDIRPLLVKLQVLDK